MLSKKLKEWGWRESEIERTLRGLERGEQLRSKGNLFLIKILFFLVFIFIFLTNAIIAFILIPVILILHGLWSFLILIFFGFLSGLLFEMLFCRLEKIRKGHYIFFGVLAPAITLISVFLIFTFANKLAIIFNLIPGFVFEAKPALTFALVYAISFISPWIYHKLRKL